VTAYGNVVAMVIYLDIGSGSMDTNYLHAVSGGLKCPDYFQMSGFAVPTKRSLKANDLKPCTPKPDRITVVMEGCKVQGLFR
jgi:hypothetical protein